MNPKYNIYEEIDRYLNHELSEGELLDFQSKLNNDSELQELVEAQKIANEIIVDNEMLKLKERMSKDMNKGNNGLSSHWGKIIALSIAVGSTAIYSYTQLNTKAETAIQNPSTLAAITENNTNAAIESKSSTPKETEQKASSTPSAKIEVKTSDKIREAPKEVSIEEPIIQKSIPSKEEVKEPIAVSSTPSKVILPPVQPELKESKVIVTNPCETSKITADVRANYSMDAYDEASIVINKSSIKGGTPPYTYALNNSDFANENRFEGLKDGTYNIRIKDKNNCISIVKKNLVILIPAHPIDEAFTPSHGERWKFPLGDRTDGSITIINKVGVTVYSTQISGGYPSEWDGIGNNGVELDLGNYYFILTFKDQKVIKGNISIIK